MLTPDERDFVCYCLAYFRLPAVALRQATVHDVAILPQTEPPTILLGEGFARSNPRRRRQKLVHELLHAAGHEHGPRMCRRGYYSNPRRDVYSRRVLADIEAGSGQYDPRRFDP